MRKTRAKLLTLIYDHLLRHENMKKAEQNDSDFNRGYHQGALNALKEILFFENEKTIEELWPHIQPNKK